MKKKIISILLVLVLTMMTAVPALAAAPKVKRTEYEGNGVVDVDFTKKVSYKSAKVVVKDPSGKKMTVKIIEKDNDDISFKVSGIKAGVKYKYTISGVRVGKSGSFGKVSGSFKTPAAQASSNVSIKKVEYDRGDKEIEVVFSTKVQYKSLKVTVKDSSGKKVTVKRIEKDDDDLSIKVSGIKSGKKYTIQLSGVSVKGKNSYKTVSKTFTAK